MEQDLVDELLDPSKQPARTPFLLLEMTAREFHDSSPPLAVPLAVNWNGDEELHTPRWKMNRSLL